MRNKRLKAGSLRRRFASPTATEALNAQFTRAHISARDFNEAREYLQVLRGRRLVSIQRALLFSAIVAYARPFTQNERTPTPSTTSQLGVKLNKELTKPELALHDKLVALRNQALAHSEYTQKAVRRVMGTPTGFVVQAKLFDVLSEPIDRKLFGELCHKMALFCSRKMMELNHKLGTTK